jgi:hypothetical protein
MDVAIAGTTICHAGARRRNCRGDMPVCDGRPRLFHRVEVMNGRAASAAAKTRLLSERLRRMT